jgi:hypothetical protein
LHRKKLHHSPTCAVGVKVVTMAMQTTFPPLEAVTRPTVDTAAAAYYLNRKPQTLRCWAVYQDGAVNPIRISGRLAWPVADLRRVLGVA